MADHGEHMKAESVLHLVGLEKKLALLQAELHALEEDHAALLTKVAGCCHNETYYLATVRDHVLGILTEVSVLVIVTGIITHQLGRLCHIHEV